MKILSISIQKLFFGTTAEQNTTQQWNFLDTNWESFDSVNSRWKSWSILEKVTIRLFFKKARNDHGLNLIIWEPGSRKELQNKLALVVKIVNFGIKVVKIGDIHEKSLSAIAVSYYRTPGLLDTMLWIFQNFKNVSKFWVGTEVKKFSPYKIERLQI